MNLALPFPVSTDLIQASLIVCGISTFVQVTGFKFGPINWGAGILSVMGVSFTSVGIWTSAINTMIVSNARNLIIIIMVWATTVCQCHRVFWGLAQ